MTKEKERERHDALWAESWVEVKCATDGCTKVEHSPPGETHAEFLGRTSHWFRTKVRRYGRGIWLSHCFEHAEVAKREASQ